MISWGKKGKSGADISGLTRMKTTKDATRAGILEYPIRWFGTEDATYQKSLHTAFKKNSSLPTKVVVKPTRGNGNLVKRRP